MKRYGAAETRVVGFFGHRHAGKTSLVESVLYRAGATARLGRVDDGQLTLEIDPVALERRTTMAANVGGCEWQGCRIGIIDTPGDANFWASTARAASVVDAAVVVVSATDGIEAITARAIDELGARRVPFVVFVSKLDKEGADFAARCAELKAELGKDAVAVALPIGGVGGLRGVVDLLRPRVTLAADDREEAIPAELAAEVASARERLCDAVAATDDALAERYLADGTLADADLAGGLKLAFLRGQLIPILAGDPHGGLGARLLLDLIRTSFPSAIERPAIRGYRSDALDAPVERLPDPDGPLVVRVFRTFHDPFAGLLTYARVFAGKLHAAEDLFNPNKHTTDRPSHLYLPQGGVKAGVEIKEAVAGDLVVLTKLKLTATGDSLTRKDDPTYLLPFEEPEALLHYTVVAADPKHEDKLGLAIARLVEEDPSLRFSRDHETKETLLGGLGQPHLDHVVERLRRAGLELELHEPKVPYRETVRAAVREVEGKHKKQTGGSGQYGVCYLHLEPLPRGAGIEFVDAIVGGAIPRNFIPAVEKGVREALRRGPLSGSEVVDVRVTLYDGKYHRVDSNDVAFQVAGRKAIRLALGNGRARPVLLEPHMELEVACPAETVGDVMGDLNARRARVSKMVTETRTGRITATVPMNEILRYANVLKSITSGRGSFHLKFDRYEEAPPEVQQAVAAKYTGGSHAEDE